VGSASDQRAQKPDRWMQSVYLLALCWSLRIPRQSENRDRADRSRTSRF
jgi:hypothetical protein